MTKRKKNLPSVLYLICEKTLLHMLCTSINKLRDWLIQLATENNNDFKFPVLFSLRDDNRIFLTDSNDPH